MEWRIHEAQSILDRFIERYRMMTGSSVPLQNNVFDYGVHFETDDIVLYNFSDTAPCQEVYGGYRTFDV